MATKIAAGGTALGQAFRSSGSSIVDDVVTEVAAGTAGEALAAGVTTSATATMAAIAEHVRNEINKVSDPKHNPKNHD